MTSQKAVDLFSEHMQGLKKTDRLNLSRVANFVFDRHCVRSYFGLANDVLRACAFWLYDAHARSRRLGQRSLRKPPSWFRKTNYLRSSHANNALSIGPYEWNVLQRVKPNAKSCKMASSVRPIRLPPTCRLVRRLRSTLHCFDQKVRAPFDVHLKNRLY